MPSRSEEVMQEAATAVRRELDRLREELANREREFEHGVAPLRSDIVDLEAALARMEGRQPDSKSGRAPRGHNRTAIARALAEGQPLTANEVAAATGISKATVQATLAKLTHDGIVEKKRAPRGVIHSLLQ